MILPTFKPISMRANLSKDKYQSIESLLLAQVALLNRKPSIEPTAVLPFLENYLADLTQEGLRRYSSADSQIFQASTHLRLACLELVEKLAKSHPEVITSPILLDIILVYASTERAKVLAILSAAVTISKADEIIDALHTAIESCFGSRKTPIDTLRSLVSATHVISLVIRTEMPTILDQFASEEHYKIIELLARVYNVMFPSISSLIAGPSHSHSSQLLVQSKISILDSIHGILTYLISDPSDSNQMNRLYSILINLTKDTQPPQGQVTVLFDAPLLIDYEIIFEFTKALEDMSTRSPSPSASADYYTIQAAFLSYSQYGLVDRKVFINLLPEDTIEEEKTPLAKPVNLPSVDIKGKGKATRVLYFAQEEDPSIDIAISQVLDILPDQDPLFLRRCLKHKSFQGEGSAERLISALLEGNIPIELSTETEDVTYEESIARPVPAQQATWDSPEIVRERRNIFDDDEIDVSNLRFGKKQDNADELIQDKAWLQEMKADILRRAEANSDEEEEEHQNERNASTYRPKNVPFEDDDDIDELDESIGDVSVAGDGEGSEESGGEEPEKPPSSIDTILELTYIENPKLFNRDAATRRSKARADLKAKTGWSDEQLEGWRIMLDRNPRKDKILQKHEFKGNKPLARLDDPADSSQSQFHRGGHANRGRGGAGRGRGAGGGRGGGHGKGGEGSGGGGGRGGGSGSGNHDRDRDRAWKEKNKSRNRTRGHDKKMAFAAPPPPTS